MCETPLCDCDARFAHTRQRAYVLPEGFSRQMVYGGGWPSNVGLNICSNLPLDCISSFAGNKPLVQLMTERKRAV